MSSKYKSERGTVLLTTLLIMALMAALTVALMDDIRVAVKRTINVHAYAQADWQARGAEDFVAAYLENDFKDLEPAQKYGLLQARVPLTLPTPDGVINLTLKDASHCFNLNAYVESDGTLNNSAALGFSYLAELLGLPQNQAVALSSALKDWQDHDQQISPGGAEDGSYLRRDPPYRTADTSLRSPDEMRSIQGMDEDLWTLFRPFVCTGPAGASTPVNINTLDFDRMIILAAALSASPDGDRASNAAQTILQNRPAGGYGSVSEALETLQGYNIEGLESSDLLGIEVTAVFVEMTTQVGPAERVRTYRYDGVDTGPLRLTYRGWGRETFRPEIEPELDAE